MGINKYFVLFLMASLFTLGSYAQDENKGPGRPGRPGGFKPQLEGVWQQCKLAAGEDGQPQLSFLPLLKFYNTDGQYQIIGIPNEGGCVATQQGSIEKTSDSTYVDKVMKMRPDSVQAEPTVVTYKLRGPMWLTLTYTEPGKAEPTTELWMRIRQQGGHDNRQFGQGRGPGDGQRGPRMGGQGGQRPGGGMRSGGSRGQNRQMQNNPFEDNSSSGSISEADD